MNKIEQHKLICKELSDMYEKKNSDYGDSFAELRKEFPESITYRLTDKLNRLKMLYKKAGHPAVVSESIEDTLKDIANYAIMELIEREYTPKIIQPDHAKDECRLWFDPLTGTQYFYTDEIQKLHKYLDERNATNSK